MKKTISIRARILLVTVLAAASVIPATSVAEAWKTDRPIKIIVPYPPGNTIDVLARLVQSRLPKEIGRQVVVENVSGAAGQIGMRAIAHADPDGYTIGAVQGGPMIVQPHTLKSLPYDVLRDFTPVAVSAWNYNILAASPAAPFTSAKDMIVWAKANPGRLTVGTNGEGSYPHLWFEDFANKAGFTFTHVPYRGASEIGSALAGDQLMVAADSMPGMRALLEAKKVRLLAVTNKERVPEAADSPTLDEIFPGFVRNGWFGFAVPAKTNPEVVEKLNAAINKIVMEPEVADKLRAFGLTPDAQSPEFFAKLIKTDYERFGAIVKAIGLQPK